MIADVRSTFRIALPLEPQKPNTQKLTRNALVAIALNRGWLCVHPSWLAPAARGAVWPFDDLARPKFGREVVLAGADPAAHRNAGLMHAVGRTGDERMPIGQIAPFGNDPVGAGDRKPAHAADSCRRQF